MKDRIFSVLYFLLSFVRKGDARARAIETSIACMPRTSPAYGRVHHLPTPLATPLRTETLVYMLSRAARAYQAEVETAPNPRETRFIEALVEHWAHSRAQVFQDIWVLSELAGKRDGFFVEFGATDGKEKSNSYLLEDRFGWRGILSEPNPSWHEALHANRSHATIVPQCVWTQSNATVSFEVSSNAELAGIAAAAQSDRHARDITQRISLETISLNDLLDRPEVPEVVDFLSIDTEGSELDILRAFDFTNGPKIRLIAVEHNYIPQKLTDLDALLQPLGYRRVLEAYSAFDGWYVLDVGSGEGP